MGRAVSLCGGVFALFCVALVLLVVPAGAQDDGGIPPGTRVTASDSNNGIDNPRVFTVESSGCRVPDQGATVIIQESDGTRFKYRDGPEVEITEVGNGQVRLESVNGDPIADASNAVSFNDSGFDPSNTPLTAEGSTGITGCEGGTAGPAQDQYSDNEVDNPDDVISDTTSKTPIPDTGGPPYLALGALLMMVAALLVGRGVLRS